MRTSQSPSPFLSASFFLYNLSLKNVGKFRSFHELQERIVTISSITYIQKLKNWYFFSGFLFWVRVCLSFVSIFVDLEIEVYSDVLHPLETLILKKFYTLLRFLCAEQKQMSSLVERLRLRSDRKPVYNLDESDDEDYAPKKDRTFEQVEAIVRTDAVCLSLLLLT